MEGDEIIWISLDESITYHYAWISGTHYEFEFVVHYVHMITDVNKWENFPEQFRLPESLLENDKISLKNVYLFFI